MCWPRFNLVYRVLLTSLLAAVAGVATSAGAQTAYPLTFQVSNVEAGQSQVFSARFLNALGQPAAGQTVNFSNDACGFFPNDGFGVSVQTDMDGVASTTFTARYPGGVTCWLIAAGAGSSVRFDVVTYGVHQLGYGATPAPADPRPGQPFTLNVSVGIWSYALRRVDISARIIPGTGTAALSPVVVNSGENGVASFQVTPQGPLGSYEIEIEFRGRTWRVPMRGSYQDVWWGGAAENGWGVSLVQHANTLVAGWYHYDAAGRPAWLIMPGCVWDAALANCTGSLFTATGAWLGSYDAARFTQMPAGTITFSFADAGNATMSYTVNGVSGTKGISRMRFGQGSTGSIDYSDVWWGGTAQNGWGVALVQQQAVLVGAWYTFDREGRATWYVMNGGTWTSPTIYQGTLITASGSPVLGVPYNAQMFAPATAGTATLNFTDADNAVMTYTVDGVTQTKAISRLRF